MLPDGKEETLPAKLGQTVQYTKALLHERFDLPMDKQVSTCLFYIVQQLQQLIPTFSTAISVDQGVSRQICMYTETNM